MQPSEKWQRMEKKVPRVVVVFDPLLSAIVKDFGGLFSSPMRLRWRRRTRSSQSDWAELLPSGETMVFEPGECLDDNRLEVQLSLPRLLKGTKERRG